MKKIFITAFIFCSISVLAHEFWLQPSKFIYKKGDTASISFRVGENFEGDNWSGNHSKINFLTFYSNNSSKDIASLVSENNGDSIKLPLAEEGTAMIVYNGLNSFIELDAKKFTDYLKEDGLKETLEYRKKNRQTDSMSHEYYQRSVKTIMQVGKIFDTTYKIQTNLPLDIIPLQHPYQLKSNGEVSFKILFKQKPFVNHLIKIWHRVNNKTIYSDKISDKNGVIKFPVTLDGQWMVSSVQMVLLKTFPNTYWQSYWGSCTWGYE